MTIKLENALKVVDGVKSLVNINDVPNGLACNCFCPACNSRLVARNNPKNKKIPHFAHHKAQECEYGVETSIHLLAKEILSEIDYIRLPQYVKTYEVWLQGFNRSGYQEMLKRRGYITPKLTENVTLFDSRTFDIKKCELEKTMGQVIPDVIIYTTDRPLYVEIYVTHKSSDSKVDFFRKKKIDALEIDLSDVERGLDKKGLKKYLFEENRITWLNNEEINQNEKHQKAIFKNERENEKRRQLAIIKPDLLKKHFNDYLGKARKWIEELTEDEVKEIEQKYGYSIFKPCYGRTVETCPLGNKTPYYCSKSCEYNATDPIKKVGRVHTLDHITGSAKCLYDLIQDRYVKRRLGDRYLEAILESSD